MMEGIRTPWWDSGQFQCGHCGKQVSVPDRACNHCPHCLWSMHVGFGARIEHVTGPACGGMLEPRNRRRALGLEVIDHHCTGCGYVCYGVPVQMTRENASALIDAGIARFKQGGLAAFVKPSSPVAVAA
jgi:hypothetical protein